VPAVVRFLSCELLLGPVDLAHVKETTGFHFNALSKKEGIAYRGKGIDWVIAGGESGPNARPMHPDWARALRDQCEAAGVPYLFKQWGEWLPWHQFNSSSVQDDAEQTRFATSEWYENQWNGVGRPF